MKRFLTLIFFIGCSCFWSAAQVEQAPPAVHRLTDSSSVLTVLQQVYKLYNEYPDSAYNLLGHTLQRSITLKFTYGAGMSHLYKGIIETNRNQLAMARQSLDQALNSLGQSPAGTRELYRVYTNLGNLDFLQGKYEDALQLQYRAIKAGEQVPGTDVNYLYANVAAILIHTGRSTESIKQYVEKARLSAMRKNDPHTLSKIYNNIALSFSMEKNWDSSIAYFRKTLDIAARNHMPTLQHLALSNIGIISLEAGRTDSALQYLQQARAMDSIAVAGTRERARGALGSTYLALGRIAEARPLLEEQYRLAQELDNKQELRASYYNLSKLYGAAQDYRQAYRHAWNYITLNDSIAGNEVIENINKIEVKYRAAEREKKLLHNQLRLSEQQKALETKNKWLLLAAVTVLLLIPVIFLVIRNYQHKRRLLAEKVRNMERDQAIRSLKAAIGGEESERSRIAKELHDGVGALVSAAKMNLGALNKDPQQAAAGDVYQSTLQLLEEIGSELRITAHNMMPVAIMDRDLPAAIRHFCNYTGKAKKLRIEVQTYGDFAPLPDTTQLAIYRIVQELINNAAKHAQAELVLVQLAHQDDILSITVEDNGRGFDASGEQHTDGVGLQSVKDRVKSMNGSLSISAQPGLGTSVYIEWELNQEAS